MRNNQNNININENLLDEEIDRNEILEEMEEK